MSLILTKGLESQNHTKYFDVIYHYVRRLVEDGEQGSEWIPSSSMLADGFTKALPVGPSKDIKKNGA